MVSALKGPSGLWMLSASILLAAVVVVLEVLSLDDLRTSEYATYEEAYADQAIQKGWIPEFVPRGATDIREQHSLDSNDLRVEFTYNGGFRDFTAGLDAVAATVRQKLLEAADLPGDWRKQAPAFVHCRDRAPGLLVIAASDGRAFYMEPLREAALAVLDPCKDAPGGGNAPDPFPGRE